MIKCEDGILQIDGIRKDLTMEMATIIRTMITEGIIESDILHSMVEAACMTPEELHKALEKELSIFLSNLLTTGERENLEQSSKRTKHAEEMLEVIKKVQEKRKGK